MANIVNWASSFGPNSNRFMLLTGPAGSGKTAISASICHFYENLFPRRLAADFYYGKAFGVAHSGHSEQSSAVDSGDMLKHLALELACIPTAAPAIHRAVNGNGVLYESVSPMSLEALLTVPLNKADPKDDSRQTSILLILDHLDAIANDKPKRRRLLEPFFTALASIPPHCMHVKVLVLGDFEFHRTSLLLWVRGGAELASHFGSKELEARTTVICLPTLSQKQDIQTFCLHQLKVLINRWNNHHTEQLADDFLANALQAKICEKVDDSFKSTCDDLDDTLCETADPVQTLPALLQAFVI